MTKKKVNELPMIIDPMPFIVDPRLGRRRQVDERSKSFPIRALLQQKFYAKPKSKIWPCAVQLDQGNLGSCVGNSFAHLLSAFPYPLKKVLYEKDAVAIYDKAKLLDDYPGTNYEGTSILGGVKATQALYPGIIESYRWAESIQDIIAVLSWFGPISVGIDWYSSFYTPDSKGVIKLGGSVVGGHAVLLRGIDIEKDLIMFKNSWGPSYGKHGSAWMPFETFDKLLNDGGDACIVVKHSWWKS